MGKTLKAVNASPAYDLTLVRSNKFNDTLSHDQGSHKNPIGGSVIFDSQVSERIAAHIGSALHVELGVYLSAYRPDGRKRRGRHAR